MKPLIAAVLAVWFGLVYALGAGQAFARPQASVPLPILVAVLVPLALFIVAYRGWRSFRELVLAADLRLLTAVQSWRVGGFAFLALEAHGLLPGLFAWPAGWGDIAIGATAPWVMLSLTRRPTFVRSRLFAFWNIAGILDLVVAVGAGVLSSGVVPGLAGDVTTAAMSRLPLVLVPAYLVPLFVMLHLVALFQARRGANSNTPAVQDWSETAVRPAADELPTDAAAA